MSNKCQIKIAEYVRDDGTVVRAHWTTRDPSKTRSPRKSRSRSSGRVPCKRNQEYWVRSYKRNGKKVKGHWARCPR